MIRLAAQENLLPGRDLEEKFEFAQSVGFDGIELIGHGGFAERVDEVRRARAAGVLMPTVCARLDRFIGDFEPALRLEAREQAKVLLSVIAEAGGHGAIIPAAWAMFSRQLPPFTPPRSAEGDREVLLEELTALGHHAASVGATVLLEPLNRYEDHMVNTLETAVSLVREVGLSSVAVTADFYHMNIEETDVAASLRAAAPHLRHVHLSDSNRREPGAGHLDWNRMIDVLDGIGYDGWLAVECQLSGAPAHVLLAVSALVRGNSPIAGRWDR